MLFPSLFEELNMERYASMAADMLPSHKLAVALCDDSGQLIWSSMASGKVQSWNQYCECKPGSETCTSCLQKGVNLVCCSLGSIAGRPAGALKFSVINDVPGDVLADELTEQVLPMLNNITSVVKTELGYLYETNSMARELGDRYDELAMLRSSDLPLTEYSESRHILSRYIRSCAEHLKVDYAAIWVPARASIYPGGIAYTADNTEMLSVLERLCVNAYSIFQNGQEAFGINDKDEDLRQLLTLPNDKKLVMVPIEDISGTPCGVLCCLNEIFSRDFTNSDICTLEAVSRETFKYLQDTRDELTGLLNRKGFEESVWREIFNTKSSWHLVLFNLDQFSVINAAYGMSTGDQVLRAVAKKIGQSVKGVKHTARLEADVFAMLIEADDDTIKNRVTEICDAIDKSSIASGGKSVSIKSRAGVIAFNSKETALADHLYAAEMAVASANEENRSRVVIYEPGNAALMKRKNQLTLVENIRQALQEDRFVLYCQRIAPLSGDESHYEILVRMIDDNGELIPPDSFIPVAERYCLMPDVDRWVLDRALQILSSDENRDIASMYKWGINLSGMTIGDADFRAFVSDRLRQYNFSPTNLYFEITETAAIKNFQSCLAFMHEIHAMGAQFALDDFGSGLSSFSYLKILSVDYLKIDGSLIKDIVNSRLDQTMVTSISKIANVLGVKTIAEYVENDAIIKVLENLEIDYAQGYGIMRPQPLVDVLVELGEKTIARHNAGF